MFEKFGELESAEELNKAAAGLKEAGDVESLIVLAEENGLDKEDAEDYAAGEMEELATVSTAALGKLKVESADLQPKEIMVDWVEYIKMQCIEKEEVAVFTQKDLEERCTVLIVKNGCQLRRIIKIDQSMTKRLCARNASHL